MSREISLIRIATIMSSLLLYQHQPRQGRRVLLSRGVSASLLSSLLWNPTPNPSRTMRRSTSCRLTTTRSRNEEGLAVAQPVGMLFFTCRQRRRRTTTTNIVDSRKLSSIIHRIATNEAATTVGRNNYSTTTRILRRWYSSSSLSTFSSPTHGTATPTPTTVEGTQLFFNWLEQKYGARYNPARPLPMTTTHTTTEQQQQQQESGEDSTTESFEDQENTSRRNTQNGNGPQVVTRSSLELDDLEQLFRHEISALQITNFYPREAATVIGTELAAATTTPATATSNDNNKSTIRHVEQRQNWQVSTSKGLESSDVFTLGRHTPYNIAVATQTQADYFHEVRNELRVRRQLPLAVSAATTRPSQQKNISNTTPSPKQPQSPPRLWPLDLLRLELDELWPHGAGLARRQQQHEPKRSRASSSSTEKNSEDEIVASSATTCMSGGLPRLMIGPTRWKKGLVHVDELAPLSIEKGCFSANIYLQLPYSLPHNDDTDTDNDTEQQQQQQPVMEIWPLNIRSKWDWYRVRTSLR